MAEPIREDHSLRIAILAEAILGVAHLVTEDKDFGAGEQVGALLYVLGKEAERIHDLHYPAPA